MNEIGSMTDRELFLAALNDRDRCQSQINGMNEVLKKYMHDIQQIINNNISSETTRLYTHSLNVLKVIENEYEHIYVYGKPTDNYLESL